MHVYLCPQATLRFLEGFFSSIVFFFDVFRLSIHVFSGILFNFIITLIGNCLSFILQSAVVRILIRCISIHIFC